MKILLLADPSSVHTIKWANSLSERNFDITIAGLGKFNKELFNQNIKVESFGISESIKSKPDGSITKLMYLLKLSKIKKIINEYKPDIVHAHYVSSYGFLGALCEYHPYIVSVWGSDIYNFPYKSIFHKKIIKYTLSAADEILSTSHTMAKQVSHFSDKKVEVVPFGVDINKFKAKDVHRFFERGDVVIGTIKTLEKKYGIDVLIKAFKIVKEELTGMKLKLLIVGEGSLKNELVELVNSLNLQADTKFTGFINPDQIPEYHNNIDIYVALSVEDSESFGVAVVEASACEKPVVVSDAGGLPEVVADNVTGFIVPKQNVRESAQAIITIIKNTELRKKLGKSGRERVVSVYNWDSNVNQMINIYNKYKKG